MRGCWIRSVDMIVGYVENVGMVARATIAALLGLAQVIMRYGFNTGFIYTQGILMHCMIFAALCGASRAVRDDIHVRLDISQKYISQKLGFDIGIASQVISLIYVSVLAVAGSLYVFFVFRLGIVSTETGVAHWISYSMVPFTMAMISGRYLMVIICWGDISDKKQDTNMEY